jgi:hypothetical protein
MYLSAERLALVNQQVQETFEQTCVAWQAIPNWDTGDPGSTRVRSDVVSDYLAAPPNPGPLGAGPATIKPYSVPFYVTLAQAIAPSPDALLAAAIARTGLLAKGVDTDLAVTLLTNAVPPPTAVPALPIDAKDLVPKLIDARVNAENSGYRAPSCLLTGTAGLKALNQFDGGYSILGGLMAAANVNSLHRLDQMNTPPAAGAGGAGGAGGGGKGGKGGGGAAAPPAPVYETILLLGRRQLIAQGGAPSASPGEEPVDLAISIPPSLEVVGETADGNVELAVRVSLGIRIKDKYGIVGVTFV